MGMLGGGKASNTAKPAGGGFGLDSLLGMLGGGQTAPKKSAMDGSDLLSMLSGLM